MTRYGSRSTPLKENTPTEVLRRPQRSHREARPPEMPNSDGETKLSYVKTPTTPSKKRPDTPPEQLTPTKQKRIDESQTSPSTMLDMLALTSPHSNKKQLFPVSRKCQKARKALHTTTPSSLPGRDKELKELGEFIRHHLEKQTSASLYVSGPPGTGKTASLNFILGKEDLIDNILQLYVNCTAIKSPGSIYSRIVKELGLKSKGKTEKDYLAVIEAHLQKPHKMVLLILDEIDRLDSKNQSILYTIFEWPAVPNSRLILIGIANALDLTDRILPRLQARCELKPKLMHFASYTKQQLVDILTARLEEADVTEVFSPVALQLLAGKIAAVSGDVRRALDIGRRVIELGEQKIGTLKSVENLEKCATVDVKHVLDVLNSVYGAAQNLNDDSSDSFPLQQKVTICSLLLIIKNARNKDVTLGKLHGVYKKVCTKRNLSALDEGEFAGLCSLLEAKGILKVVGKKEPRLNKVSLEWDEEEVAEALKDRQLMSTILQDQSSLGKM